MAAAAAAEAPPLGGGNFAFSEAGRAADDFRQAPDRSEGSRTLPVHASPQIGVFTTSAAAAGTVPSADSPSSHTANAPVGGAASGFPASSSPQPAPASADVFAALRTTSAAGAAVPVLPLTPGETALLEYRNLGRKCRDKGLTDLVMPTMAEEDLDQFGWQEALRISMEPGPWTLPVEALSHKPTPDEIHKFFFKGTPILHLPATDTILAEELGLTAHEELLEVHRQLNIRVMMDKCVSVQHEVCIRQIFFHVPLSLDEQQWLQDFRQKCSSCNWAIPFFLEPHVLRLVWFCKRKYPEDAINKSLEHAQLMVEWRRQLYPICDTEDELRKLLEMGVMYWVGRDTSLRPLLIVRQASFLFPRLPLGVYSFATTLVPGVVETCVVLFDVRTVPLHQFPLSALTDMVTTLTKQFPFRLHRMWIINDSFFVQSIISTMLQKVQRRLSVLLFISLHPAVLDICVFKTLYIYTLDANHVKTAWNIVKQFLTDVQQQKIKFYRTGFETELLKEYAPHQLENHYGGTREAAAREEVFAVPPWKAADRFTTFGVVWENNCRVPLQWKGGEIAAEVFRAAGLRSPPQPITLEDEKTAKALEVVEKATLAQRTFCIQSYKSMVQRLSTVGRTRSTVWPGGGERDFGSSAHALEEPITQRRGTFGLVGSEMSKRLSNVEYTDAVNEPSTGLPTDTPLEAPMRTGFFTRNDAAGGDTGLKRDTNACGPAAAPASATTTLSTHESSPPAAGADSGTRAQEDVTGSGAATGQTQKAAIPVTQRSKEASVREKSLEITSHLLDCPVTQTVSASLLYNKSANSL